MQKPASIELGPYQLLERIGEGGSGQVYRATGPTGPVAIKLLGLASEMDDAARARFRREVTALGQLAHPHLVALIDHGVDAELGPYLVLPLLAGTHLRALCGGRALCPEAALLLILPIVHATAALHAAGYVHRDLKPENAIAGPDGVVTVIDLGLAWREGMTRHTDTGTAVGSVGYMAPEQIEGRRVGGPADVWALGVMIYEWIAGKRPFARPRPAEEAAAMLVGVCPRLDAADRRCDPALATLVARCLALDPASRPGAAELASALEPLVDWCAPSASESAAVIADPLGYQARVAAFRVQRIERQARAAIDAGEPFVALAACDRGLAYAPDHPRLLELVAAAEAATARAPGRVEVRSEAGAAPVVTDRALPVAVAAPSEPTRRGRARWPWIVGLGLGVWFAVIVIYLAVPDRPPRSEPAAPRPAAPVDRDRELVGDLVSLFGQALSRDPPRVAPTPGVVPTTATGWYDLAAAQPPAEAVRSLRQALALNPTWLDAQVALCGALVRASDAGAIAACDVALRRRPDDVELRAARGLAHLRAGDPRAALADLDRVVGADPDPRWRRLRARARTAAGDLDGARTDRAHACELGDATACQEASDGRAAGSGSSATTDE